MVSNFLDVIPVLPSLDIDRDIKWYEEKAGFKCAFADKMYAGVYRDNIFLHLQWHAGTIEDPLNGGSVIRIFVSDINPIFEEFVQRGTIVKEKLNTNTAWGTHEFGFFDLNQNGIFIVQDLDRS
jgi:hypothetical protein